MKYIFAIVMLSPWCTFAQDSLPMLNRTEYFNIHKQMSLGQVTTMNWFQADTFGVLTAGWGKNSGGFHQSQDAMKRRDLVFSTEGLKQVKKVRFYGAFDFNHFRADSVGNTLQYDYNDEAPYYLIAFRKGSWNGLTYDFKGMLDWEMNKQFNLIAGVRYQASNKWRSQDPRPEYFNQNQEYSAAIQYKPHEKHSFSIGATWSARNLETRVSYADSDLAQQTSTEIYVTNIILGYAVLRRWGGEKSMFRDAKGLRYQASYSFSNDKWKLYLNANYKNEDELIAQRIESSNDIGDRLGTVNQGLLELNGFTSIERNNHKIYAGFYLRDNILKNHDLIEFKEYAYLNQKTNLKVLIGNLVYKNERPAWEYNLQTAYQDWARKNFASDLFHLYSNLALEAGVSKFQYFKNNNTLHITLKGGYQFPIESRLGLGNDFYTSIPRIVNYDYYFYNASVVNASVNMEYLFPYEKVNFFVGARANVQWAKLPETTVVPFTYPGTSRTAFQLRFGVFL